MIDTCQANTMYSKFYSPNILATGSSKLDQNSFLCVGSLSLLLSTQALPVFGDELGSGLLAAAQIKSVHAAGETLPQGTRADPSCTRTGLYDEEKEKEGVGWVGAEEVALRAA
ncbi:hypothetical protein C8R44DRAFT_876185 [Mycena epipterygia]|nr:hypothetical protein C8R44DRAFT_876185 [Mycena epipterygia]